MTSPLAGSLARQIGHALKPLMLPLTLRRTTQGAYDPITDTYATVTTDYGCSGYVDAYSRDYEAKNLALPSDRKVVILATSLAVTPDLADHLVIDGEVFTVHHITRDPAAATWTLQARK